MHDSVQPAAKSNLAEETPRYPLATSSWDDAEYAALQSVIAANRFTMGPRVAQFETKFAQHFGASHAIMVNSGSSANLLAVAAAVLDPTVDLSPGDEVIVPAVSWATTFYPLHQYGLTLRFVDIDLDTLNLSVDQVERAIGPRTKGIVAVNLLGNPCDYSRLMELVRAHGLLLIEDNCESLGASQSGQLTGTFGLMGTFSTFFSHHISTMEGGIVLTNDDRLAQMLVSLRAHGWTRELPEANHIYEKSGDAFDDLFRFVLPGYNVRPLEMSGAVGIEQLKKVPSLIAGRRANAVYFEERFAAFEAVRTQRETGVSSWFGFSIVLEGSLVGRRREVVGALTAAGVESRPIVAGNFTRNPVMAHLRAIVPDELPAADRVHEDGFFVGNHHYPLEQQIDLLHDTLATLA